MANKGKHIVNWSIFENRLVGEWNGKAICTSEIQKTERFEDMVMITTRSGSIYFVYDDERAC